MDKALLAHAARVLEVIASLQLSSSHLNKLIKGSYLADFFIASVSQQFAHFLISINLSLNYQFIPRE